MSEKPMEEMPRENESTQAGPSHAEAAPDAVVRAAAGGWSGRVSGSEEERIKLIQRIILYGAVFAFITIASYVVLYLRTGAPQIVLDLVGLLLGTACLIPAFLQARRGRHETAGYWILAAVFIVFGAGELSWSDATLHQTVSVVLLFVLVGSVLRPLSWRRWLVALAGYLVFVLVLNVLLANQPGLLQRYPVLDEAPFTQYISIPLALLILWQVLRAIRVGTIRARLLFAFVALVLLATLVTSIAAALVSFGGGRRAAVNQLEAVVGFKGEVVSEWVQRKHDALAAAMAETRPTSDFVISASGSSLLDVALYSRALLTLAEGDETNRISFGGSLEQALQGALVQTGEFDDMFVVNMEGEVLVSTDEEQVGANVSDQPYFERGQLGAYAQPPFEDPLAGGETVVVVVRRVFSYDELVGFIVGRASADSLIRAVTERTGLTGSGVVYLVEGDGTRLGDPEGQPISSDAIREALAGHGGSGQYENQHGVDVVGAYEWLPELELALIAEQDQREAFAATYTSLGITLGVTAAAVAVAVFASLYVTRGIATPLAGLARTAAQVAAGDLEQTTSVERDDEIGALAAAFNSMTGQLRELVGGLEQRVGERTRYLQAAADVGRAVALILEPDRLIEQVVELIRVRFDLYYVGLFLVGETGEWAKLQAGTGEAGQAMLARGHRIRIGEGMIGWCVANARARIALDVGEDAVRLATAELPNTRSEAALPLRSRGQIVGALTVQSDQPAAFDEAAIAVLQTMADQVAVALENARLFTESQAALEAAHRAYGEMSGEAWRELTASRADLCYRSGEQGTIGGEGIWKPEMEQALQTGEAAPGNGSGAMRPLAVPIKVRGEVIGVLDTQKPGESGEWTADEIDLLEEIAEQLGVALDSARLYQDTQRRATREQLTREIADRLRRVTDMDKLMQAALREMSAALGASSAFVQFGVPPESSPGPSPGDRKGTGRLRRAIEEKA